MWIFRLEFFIVTIVSSVSFIKDLNLSLDFCHNVCYYKRYLNETVKDRKLELY